MIKFIKILANSDLKTIEKSILGTPALKDLSPEQLAEIAKLVIVQKYTKEMSRDVELMKFDYDSLKNTGLSDSTVRQYTVALSSCFSFAERKTDGIIKNSFRGTRACPKAKTNNAGKFYNICINDKTLNDVAADIETILSHIDNYRI